MHFTPSVFKMLVRISVLSRSNGFDDDDLAQPAENNFIIVPFSTPNRDFDYDDDVFDNAESANECIEIHTFFNQNGQLTKDEQYALKTSTNHSFNINPMPRYTYLLTSNTSSQKGRWPLARRMKHLVVLRLTCIKPRQTTIPLHDWWGNAHVTTIDIDCSNAITMLDTFRFACITTTPLESADFIVPSIKPFSNSEKLCITIRTDRT